MVGTMILIMMHPGTIPIGPIILLIVVSMLCSLGIAGVGGGATAAGLMLFGAMGWTPYTAIILALFSVEAFIDMGRTALNVQGAHVAAIVAGKFTGALDLKGEGSRFAKPVVA